MYFYLTSQDKFQSQNTTNLLSIINVATCFDSQSHHLANHWTVFKVHQVKVHIFGIRKCLQEHEESVNTVEDDNITTTFTLKYVYVYFNPLALELDI